MDTTNTTLSTPNVTSNTGIQVKIPSDIPASTFSNAPSTLAIPNIPTPTVPDISSDSALQQAKAYVAQIQPEQSQAEKDRQTFVQQYKDLLDTPAKESATAQAYKDTGINDLVAKINDYTAQITAIDDMNEAKKLSIGQNVGGLTVSGVQNEEARINRESAIKKLSISASLAAVQGKFNTAKSLVDQAITIKYADQQAKIDRVKAFLELNKEDIGREDKKQTQILAERQRILDEKKANDKAIGDMIINAASANAPSALVAKAQAAKTPSEAAMILGQYAGDYYKTELLKSQIASQKAETAKKYAELKALDLKNSPLSLVGSNIVAPNGDSIGLPTDYLSAIAKTKLTEGQSNAVAFVSRMIQADKAIQDQLGTVNTKGGYYETSGYDPTSAGSAIGRIVGSDASRIYNTNAQDFIRAKLRKESGATISPEEMSADTPIYTPSGAGLDEKDLLLAQTKRNEAIKSMIAQAGPAAPLLLDYYTKSSVVSGINYTPTGDKVLDDYAKTSLINLNAAQTSVTPAKQAGYNF